MTTSPGISRARSGLDGAPSTSPARKAAILAVALIVEIIVTSVVAVIARAAGASSRFLPLQPGNYIFLAVVGTLLGAAGWAAFRRFAPRPRAVLRIIVPVFLLVSFVPDLTVARGETGSSAGAVVALMIMHVLVAAIAIPAFSRALPLPADAG